MNARAPKLRGLRFGTPWKFSIGCSPQKYAVPVAIIRKSENQLEVDAGGGHLTHPPTQPPSKLGQAPQAQADHPGSSQPLGPILKMCVTAQAPPRYFSGTTLADQVEPNGVVRRGKADDLDGPKHKWSEVPNGAGSGRSERRPYSCHPGSLRQTPIAASAKVQPAAQSMRIGPRRPGHLYPCHGSHGGAPLWPPRSSGRSRPGPSLWVSSSAGRPLDQHHDSTQSKFRPCRMGLCARSPKPRNALEIQMT